MKWSEDRLQSMLGDSDVTDVLKIRLPSFTREDKFCWPHDPFGLYTVRSGYHFLRTKNEDLNDDEKFWKVLWKMKVLPKIRHFIWRVKKCILPTKRSLFVRTISPTDLCPVCSMATKSIDHVFVDCSWLGSLWSSSGLYSSPLAMNGDGKIFQWLALLVEDQKYDDLVLGMV